MFKERQKFSIYFFEARLVHQQSIEPEPTIKYDEEINLPEAPRELTSMDEIRDQLANAKEDNYWDVLQHLDTFVDRPWVEGEMMKIAHKKPEALTLFLPAIMKQAWGPNVVRAMHETKDFNTLIQEIVRDPYASPSVVGFKIDNICGAARISGILVNMEEVEKILNAQAQKTLAEQGKRENKYASPEFSFSDLNSLAKTAKEFALQIDTKALESQTNKILLDYVNYELSQERLEQLYPYPLDRLSWMIDEAQNAGITVDLQAITSRVTERLTAALEASTKVVKYSLSPIKNIENILENAKKAKITLDTEILSQKVNESALAMLNRGRGELANLTLDDLGKMLEGARKSGIGLNTAALGVALEEFGIAKMKFDLKEDFPGMGIPADMCELSLKLAIPLDKAKLQPWVEKAVMRNLKRDARNPRNEAFVISSDLFNISSILKSGFTLDMAAVEKQAKVIYKKTSPKKLEDQTKWKNEGDAFAQERARVLGIQLKD